MLQQTDVCRPVLQEPSISPHSALDSARDRHGPTVCVLTGLAIAATGAAVFALAQGPALAIAGYALIGSAYAVGPPAYGLLAARTLPPRVLPLGMAGLSFSVGAPLLGLLIWMLRGRISAAYGPLVASSGAEPVGSLSIASILSISEVRICCFVAFAMGGTLYSTGSLWNKFISRVVWEHTAEQKSFLVSLYWTATMLGAPTAALIALRASPFVLLRVMTALACLAVSAWTLGPRVLGAAAQSSELAPASAWCSPAASSDRWRCCGCRR